MTAPSTVARCPCLCGCPCHIREVCGSCGCSVYAPDYVAGARAAGDRMTVEYVAELTAAQLQTAKALGYLGRPGRGRKAVDARELVRCRYCGGRFRGTRADAASCSAACRKALEVALSYDDDADVPVASIRHSTFSRARAEATGFGLVTATDATHHDLRARRWSRMFGKG